MATLPHEREKMFLDDIVDDCLKGRNKLVVIVISRSHEINWFSGQIQDIAEGLSREDARQIRIFRSGIEFDNGAKVVFTSMDNSEFLRGVSPDRIIIMGSQAEFWYLAMSSGAKIEAVA